MKDFFQAIKEGNISYIRNLLSEHPTLSGARTENGVSAVLLAIYYNEPTIAQLLVEYGAPMNIFEACALGHVEWVKNLLAQQQDMANAVAPDGFTPLGLAAFFGHLPVVEVLLAHGARENVPSHNDQKVTPLHSAVASQQVRIARLLLEHGADPNARQIQDFTPLHGAAQNGQVEMIQLLLEFGADPALTSTHGKTPRDLALECGYTGAAEMLR